MSKAITAILKVGTNNKKIAITELTMKNCTALMGFNVTRLQSVSLQLVENKGNGKVSAFSPIPATVEAVGKKTVNGATYVEAKLKFNVTISAIHGVAQLQMATDRSIDGNSSAQEESKNSSLFTIPVTCHMCGQQHIPFLSLQKHTMAVRSNIFGVPQYTEALSGKEFCDYNLLRINVCPSCYFASGYVADFIRESKTVKNPEEPFNKEPIITQWNADVDEREKIVQSHLDGFFSEKRSLEQALLSYDLAIASCDARLKAEQAKSEGARNYEIARKAVFYMVTKAEVLVNNGKIEKAVNLLQNALTKIDEIFPYLKRESSIKAMFLRGMLGLYFEIPKIVNESLNYLVEYDKRNKISFGSDEQKTLLASVKNLKTAYQSRADFSRQKLKAFNKPFEY